MKNMIRFCLVTLLLLSSSFVNPWSSLVLAQDTNVAGIWNLSAQGISVGCTEDTPCQTSPPYLCGTDICGSFQMGDSDIHVSQSGSVLSASEGDINGNLFTLDGTISGDIVSFTIQGLGITPGVGPATTAYTGTLNGNTISGNLSGSTSWVRPETVTWTGTFTVTITSACESAKPIEENIMINSLCPPNERKKNTTWGNYGRQPEGILVFNSGEKLEIECSNNSFKMFYTKPDGSKLADPVGKCPFEGGVNDKQFFHAGDINPKDGKPDCLIRTRWTSRDYGGSDDSHIPDNQGKNPWTGVFEPNDDKIDWAITRFEANSKKVTRLAEKYNKRAGVDYPIIQELLEAPPEVDKFGETIILADPTPGIDTEALFDKANQLTQLTSSDYPMADDTISKSCDLDRNGYCDSQDFYIFQNAIGACEGGVNYSSLADGNADGCITNADETYVFHGDLNYDGAVNQSDYNLFRAIFGKCSGQSGFNINADYDGDGCINFVDYQIWYGYYKAR